MRCLLDLSSPANDWVESLVRLPFLERTYAYALSAYVGYLLALYHDTRSGSVLIRILYLLTGMPLRW